MCEVHRKQTTRKTGIGRDPLGEKIAARRIVLMQRVDTHAIARRMASLGNCIAPGIVAFVADADPIDGHQHDGLLIVGLENDAPGTERIVDARLGRYQGIAQRRADRRRDIQLKRGHAQIDGQTGPGE